MSRELGDVWRDGDKNDFTWEIPDFFKQAEDEEVDWMYSARFPFSGCIWQMKLNTRFFLSSGFSLRVFMCMIEAFSDAPKTVRFKCGLTKSDGTLVETNTERYDFSKNKDNTSVYVEGLNAEILRRGGDDLVPYGTLTIVCSMQHLEIVSRTPDPDVPRPVEVAAPTPASKYLDKLVRDLEGLLASGDGSDATVRVKGQEIRVHRNILGARMPVFAAMFRNDMLEKTSGVMEIEDCEPGPIRMFLQYAYTGDVGHLTPEGAAGAYEVADKYQVDELKEACLECLKRSLSVESFCRTISLALDYEEKELTALATDFYVRNVNEIHRTVEWQSFLCENSIQANELVIRSHGHVKK